VQRQQWITGRGTAALIQRLGVRGKTFDSPQPLVIREMGIEET